MAAKRQRKPATFQVQRIDEKVGAIALIKEFKSAEGEEVAKTEKIALDYMLENTKEGHVCQLVKVRKKIAVETETKKKIKEL